MKCLKIPITEFRLLKKQDLKQYARRYDAVEVVGNDDVVSIRIVLRPQKPQNHRTKDR